MNHHILVRPRKALICQEFKKVVRLYHSFKDLKNINAQTFMKSNPAYRRPSISQPVRIVAPIPKISKQLREKSLTCNLAPKPTANSPTIPSRLVCQTKMLVLGKQRLYPKSEIKHFKPQNLDTNGHNER